MLNTRIIEAQVRVLHDRVLTWWRANPQLRWGLKAFRMFVRDRTLALRYYVYTRWMIVATGQIQSRRELAECLGRTGLSRTVQADSTT